MKLFTHPASTALGLAVLCCLGVMSPVIGRDHIWIFHDSGAASSVFLPLLFTLGILWALFGGLLWFARGPGRFRRILWSGLILMLPWMVLEDGQILQAWNFSSHMAEALLLCSLLCWLVFSLGWRPHFLPHFERMVNFWQVALAFVALNNALVVGQLLWCFWAARALQEPRPLHVHAVQATGDAALRRPRVIWIVLDELSYQQVYERRFPGLELPAFDRLAGQATNFTHVQPAGMFTEDVLQSLMTGLPADDIRASADGTQLKLHDPATGQWRPFDPKDTIFRDALEEGYSTAIAGWYNSYCRYMPEVLDHCFWTYGPNNDQWIMANDSVWSNMVAPLRFAASLARTHDLNLWLDERMADSHIADDRQISAAGDGMLADPSIDFLLLHLPVPHPSGIYNRSTGAFADHGGSYVDNLALADRYLAHVREVLEQQGEWDSSAVVVMGDHSWRTKRLWAGTSTWTAEDQAASHGVQFDDRPAYLVKLPQQMQGARIDGQFAAMQTRALLRGILNGQIRSAGELAAFAGTPAQHD